MKIIATIHNDFKEKFGIPKQSGIVSLVHSKIVFAPEFRRPEAFRGLLDFSHIWLIWNFSRSERESWSPTVRPPRLGGNTRLGVFATRSPFRPNPIGLSAVRLLDIEYSEKDGPVLTVCGADLLDGTPIYDIKPYLPLSDSIPDAKGGFSENIPLFPLTVNFPGELLELVLPDKRQALIDILSLDPRPAYHGDTRDYGLTFASYNIKFFVLDNILTVTEVLPLTE